MGRTSPCFVLPLSGQYPYMARSEDRGAAPSAQRELLIVVWVQQVLNIDHCKGMAWPTELYCTCTCSPPSPSLFLGTSVDGRSVKPAVLRRSPNDHDCHVTDNTRSNSIYSIPTVHSLFLCTDRLGGTRPTLSEKPALGPWWDISSGSVVHSEANRDTEPYSWKCPVPGQGRPPRLRNTQTSSAWPSQYQQDGEEEVPGRLAP